MCKEVADDVLVIIALRREDTTASGYTLSSGISIFKTKEELLKRLESAIDCDYESALEADWHNIHMYLKMEKDEQGDWVYTVMNECYG